MPFDCIQGLQQLSKVRISYGRHEGGTLFSLASRPFSTRVVSKTRISIQIDFATKNHAMDNIVSRWLP